jgi:hypothetical protein
MSVRVALGALCLVVSLSCVGEEELAVGGDVLEQLRLNGLGAEPGVATPFRIEDCLELENCFGNNASSAYLLFSVPPAPEQGELEEGVVIGSLPGVTGDMSPRFLLRQDEAIVLVGRLPPEVRYFSFAPYLFDRVVGGERVTVFASLGDALNVSTINTAGGEVFGESSVVILSAHAPTESRVREGLVAQGVDPRSINSLVLDSSRLRLGLNVDADDTFLVLGRVSLFADASEGEAYLEEMPWSVYRVTPKAERAVEPLPVPARRSRGTGTDESGYEEALEALDLAIRESYADASISDVGIASATVVQTFLDPDSCIAQNRDCRGDVSDTTYAAGPLGVTMGTDELLFPSEPEALFVAYGVNHEASGKATYANVVLNNQARFAGVVAFDSRSMVGSAHRYLPEHPQRDALFAVHFRRDCSLDAHPCVEVPRAFPGVSDEESLFFVFRAYLESATGVGPAAAEVLAERVLMVRP